MDYTKITLVDMLSSIEVDLKTKLIRKILANEGMDTVQVTAAIASMSRTKLLETYALLDRYDKEFRS